VRQPAWKIQAAIARLLDTMTLAELMTDDVSGPPVRPEKEELSNS
jgi:hypothetical protein